MIWQGRLVPGCGSPAWSLGGTRHSVSCPSDPGPDRAGQPPRVPAEPRRHFLQRYTGRLIAVLVVVALSFSAMGAIAWSVTGELRALAHQLPAYRHTIRQRIADVRGASKGSAVEKVQETVKDIKEAIQSDPSPKGPDKPVSVTSVDTTSGLWGFPTALGPVLDALATSGLVVILAVFMLLEQQELRNRFIRLQSLHPPRGRRPCEPRYHRARRGGFSDQPILFTQVGRRRDLRCSSHRRPDRRSRGLPMEVGWGLTRRAHAALEEIAPGCPTCPPDKPTTLAPGPSLPR